MLIAGAPFSIAFLLCSLSKTSSSKVESLLEPILFKKNFFYGRNLRIFIISVLLINGRLCRPSLMFVGAQEPYS